MAVEVYRLIRTNIFIGARESLTFARSGKSLYATIGHSIDCRSCPRISVFGISQTRTARTGGNTEVASSRTDCSPPNTVFHSVLGTNDALHHIVQLIVCGNIAVGLDMSIKVGVMVEIASQLMSITLVDIRFHMIVPLLCAVIVASISCTDTYPVKERIFLYQFGHSLEVILSALIACSHVGFVERSYGHHFQAVVHSIFCCSLNHFIPFLWMMSEGIHIDVDRIAVEQHTVRTAKRDMLQSRTQITYLSVGKSAVGIHLVHHLEGDTPIGEIVLAYKVNSTQDVTFVIPCRVHTPFYRSRCAFAGTAKRHLNGISIGRCRELRRTWCSVRCRNTLSANIATSTKEQGCKQVT